MVNNWCFWTVVLDKTLESPLDSKEIQPVHSKGNWSWIFTGRTDAEAETPILWPPELKNWLIWKDPDAGKDWWQEEKGMKEEEMVGWHHRLDGHEFEWVPGDGDGQGGLACYSPWGWKESHLTDWTTEQQQKNLPSPHQYWLLFLPVALQYLFFPSCASYPTSAQALANILFTYPQKLCIIWTNHFQSWHYFPCQFKLVSREPGLHLTFRVIKCSPIMILLAPWLFRKYWPFPVEL